MSCKKKRRTNKNNRRRVTWINENNEILKVSGVTQIMAEKMTEARLVELVENTIGYEDTEHKETKALILKLYEIMSVIEPVGEDERRELWLRVPIDKDSRHTTKKEKWHKLTTHIQFGSRTVTLGNTMLFVIRESPYNTNADHSELAAWLLEAAGETIEAMKAGIVWQPPKSPPKRISASLYMESKVKFIKHELTIIRDLDGYLFSDGRRPTKILPGDLPEWYVYGYLYKRHGYISAKGVKHLIYTPNYIIKNHVFKYDTLFISYDKEIEPYEDERGHTWYRGYDHALGGSILRDFVDAVGKYSDFDVTEIQREIERKIAFYYEHNPKQEP